jgi:hypothetical protein
VTSIPVAVNPAINDNNWRSKYNNKRIPSKKKSHCFFFVAAAAFGDLLDFVMLLPFFVGGGVSSLSKRSKDLVSPWFTLKTI